MNKEEILKKAMGYTVTESVEEYNNVDGQLQLTKKKISEKYIPPDFSLLKSFINEETYEKMSLEELKLEKLRLLQELKQETI